MLLAAERVDVYLLGLLSRANPHLKLIALDIPHLRKPKIRYNIGFNLGICKKKLCFVTPFGVAVRGNATLTIACIGHSVLGEH